MTTQTEQRMMSIRRGAKYMGVSLERLNYLVKTGDIPVTRYSPTGSRYVERTDLDRFIDQKQAETREAEDPHVLRQRVKHIVRRTVAGNRKDHV